MYINCNYIFISFSVTDKNHIPFQLYRGASLFGADTHTHTERERGGREGGRERERERESVCVRERVRERVRVCGHS